MKQIILLISTLLLIVGAMAQDSDTVMVEEVEKPIFLDGLTSLYLGFGLEGAPTPDGTEPSIQFQIGAEYKKFQFGLTYLDYQGEYQQKLIFPNDFSMLYRHAGVYVGRNLWQTNLIKISAQVQWSHGDVVWKRTGNAEDVFRDKMTIWQPALQVEVDPAPLVSVYANVGYRQVNGLDLPKISSPDFSGLAFQFGIRVGLFRKEKNKSDDDEESP